MGTSLTILLLDDEETDRRAVRRGFRGASVQPVFHEAESCFSAREALESGIQPDIALVDYKLRDGTGAELLPDLTRAEVPVVIVTGYGSEEVAVTALRGGVSDYVVKDTAGTYVHALPVIVEGVVTRSRATRAREAMLDAAERQWQNVRNLVHICSRCKKIREANCWIQLESYLANRHGLALSHGFCPNCLEAALREFETH